MMEKKESNRTLADETVRYAGMLLRYQLKDTDRIDERFLLVVSNGGEHAEISVGNDICFAALCYRSVRDGRVTPFALDEIVYDLRVTAQNFEKPLYK